MAEGTEGTEGNEPEGTEQDAGAKPDDLGDAGKRALAAERKARAAAEKRAKELEAKVREAEDAEKTELERLQGQVATLEKRAEAAEAKADRFEVAAAKGLSLAQARRLVGSTKEELEEDADAMRSELGLNKDEPKDDESKGKEQEQGKGDEVFGRPKEILRAGASNEDDEELDASKLADSVLSSNRF